MRRLFCQHPRVILFAIMILAGIIVTPQATAAFKYLTEGMDAPEVKGKDITTGEFVSSKELAKDNLVIVVFWSTWSARSLEQLRDMNEFLGEYRANPIKVIAVNVDGPELSNASRQTVEATVKNMNLSFPVIIDKGLDFFYSFGVIAVPSTAVVDTSGTLRYGPAGYSLTTRDRIVDSIQIFLGLKQPDSKTVFREGYRPKKRASRFYNMALSLNRIGMLERALAVIDSAKSADSLFSAPYALSGDLMISLERYEEAVSEYAQAVALDSLSVAAWSGWGRSLLKAGQLELAQEKLTKTLLLDNAYTPAFLDLGLCLAEAGQNEQAIDSLLKARELNLADPMVHYYLGQVYQKAGQNSQAAQSYSKTLKLIYPPE